MNGHTAPCGLELGYNLALNRDLSSLYLSLFRLFQEHGVEFKSRGFLNRKLFVLFLFCNQR